MIYGYDIKDIVIWTVIIFVVWQVLGWLWNKIPSLFRRREHYYHHRSKTNKVIVAIIFILLFVGVYAIATGEIGGGAIDKIKDKISNLKVPIISEDYKIELKEVISSVDSTKINLELTSTSSKSYIIALGKAKVVTKEGNQIDTMGYHTDISSGLLSGPDSDCTSSFEEELYPNVKKSFTLCFSQLKKEDKPILYFSVRSNHEYKPTGSGDILTAFSPEGGTEKELSFDLVPFIEKGSFYTSHVQECEEALNNVTKEINQNEEEVTASFEGDERYIEKGCLVVEQFCKSCVFPNEKPFSCKECVESNKGKMSCDVKGIDKTLKAGLIITYCEKK